MSFSLERIAAAATVIQLWWEKVPPSKRKDRYSMTEIHGQFGGHTGVIGRALESLGWTRLGQTSAKDPRRYWSPPIRGAEREVVLNEMKAILRKAPQTLETLKAKFNLTGAKLRDALDELREQGFNLHQFGNHVEISSQPGPSAIGDEHVLTTDKNGYIKLGFTTDNHLCSKYAREDVLAKLYDWFAAEGCTTVLNAGNWIDGEARFNKHDLFVHGMENQVDYFVSNFPRREGIVTKFVSGDDHEGWYGQREGVDIGSFTESKARAAGRTDLIHLGFIEAYLKVCHGGVKGAGNNFLLVHPGGGSAYALSYAAQKYVEALQGGEKPGAVFFGHWHKIFDFLIRSVVCLGGGCTKDLDPFGRKNKLAYHLGGMIAEFWLDEKGAVARYRTEKQQFFDRGYYNKQWSYTGRPRRRAV